jgi:uncharacterized protein (TIGR03086 family)
MAAADRGPALMERAVRYGLSSLEAITPAVLFDQTPCTEWNLLALLEHVTESLTALAEGPCAGRITRTSAAVDETLVPFSWADECVEDMVADVRSRAEALLRDWRRMPTPIDDFVINDAPIPIGAVEIIAAIEIAVHGWDIFETCRTPSPVPVHLALELLRLSPMVVVESVRPGLFAAPIDICPLASPSDRLVAFLGRRSTCPGEFST